MWDSCDNIERWDDISIKAVENNDGGQVHNRHSTPQNEGGTWLAMLPLPPLLIEILSD